jgi:hypothetical protein
MITEESRIVDDFLISSLLKRAADLIEAKYSDPLFNERAWKEAWIKTFSYYLESPTNE